MYMTVKQAAEKWEISDRHVRAYCARKGRFQASFVKDASG